MKTLQQTLIFSMVEEFTATFNKAGRIAIYLVLLIIFSSAMALLAGVFINAGNIYF